MMRVVIDVDRTSEITGARLQSSARATRRPRGHLEAVARSTLAWMSRRSTMVMMNKKSSLDVMTAESAVTPRMTLPATSKAPPTT